MTTLEALLPAPPRPDADKAPMAVAPADADVLEPVEELPPPEPVPPEVDPAVVGPPIGLPQPHGLELSLNQG
jgi:hypothetical protein